MAMPEDLRRRLDANRKAKRGTLLKDVAPVELQVACDHAEEQTGAPSPCVDDPRECVYLRYATDAQVEALARRLACVTVLVNAPHTSSGMRTVRVFHRATLVSALRLLGLNADRYLRRLDTIHHVSTLEE